MSTAITDTLSHLQTHWQTLSQRLSVLTQDIQTTTILLQRHGEIYRAPLNILRNEKKDIKVRMREIVTQVEEVRRAIEKSQQLVRKMARDEYQSSSHATTPGRRNQSAFSSGSQMDTSNLVYVKTVNNDPIGINSYISKAAPSQ